MSYPLCDVLANFFVAAGFLSRRSKFSTMQKGICALAGVISPVITLSALAL
jgi:hypothetical protein